MMEIPGGFEHKFLALRALGIGDFVHLNGALETHLVSTWQLLIRWGNPEPLCDAGLFHAVYGTQPMGAFGLEQPEYDASLRQKVIGIIGKEAEQLVYLYGACDRNIFYPTVGSASVRYKDRFSGNELKLSQAMLSSLLELTIANELEICIANPVFMVQVRDWYVELFDRFNGLVSNEAYLCYQNTFDSQ